MTLPRLLFAIVFAFALSAAPPAGAADKIGVVLLHGKGGTALPKSPTGRLAAALGSAGFAVARPDMPWSRTRIYEKDYEASMAEIDDAVAGLRAAGATKIVVGGHSMGANAALGYGARRDGLAGVMAIAPGHVPDNSYFQRMTDGDYRRARQMVAAGKGDEAAEFKDLDQGRTFTVLTKAAVYLSWFDPEGPAVFPKNATRLKSGTALLWIVGDKDPMVKRGDLEGYAYDKAPKHPKSAFVVIESNHRNAPIDGAERIIAWLNAL